MSEQHRMKGQSLSRLGSGLAHLKVFLFLMTEGILIPIPPYSTPCILYIGNVCKQEFAS